MLSFNYSWCALECDTKMTCGTKIVFHWSKSRLLIRGKDLVFTFEWLQKCTRKVSSDLTTAEIKSVALRFIVLCVCVLFHCKHSRARFVILDFFLLSQPFALSTVHTWYSSYSISSTINLNCNPALLNNNKTRFLYSIALTPSINFANLVNLNPLTTNQLRTNNNNRKHRTCVCLSFQFDSHSFQCVSLSLTSESFICIWTQCKTNTLKWSSNWWRCSFSAERYRPSKFDEIDRI